MTNKKNQTLKLRKLGIDTYKESVIYMRSDCHVCISEGFQAHARVKVKLNNNSIVATVNIVTSELLGSGEVSLSDYAWKLLGAKNGDEVVITHARHVESTKYLRAKIYGKDLEQNEIQAIINDIALGRYSDIYISSFITACAGGRMTIDEIAYMTQAMISAGETLYWDADLVVDKHCVGGLPGNRTTPIIVSIITAFGLHMPKTSSRAITSPAGTADTMEVLAPVELTAAEIKDIVKKENGCIVWGGSISLSPADDIMIGVERSLNLDSQAQLVASILSKKISAGSTHVLIDIPVGDTAKVRSLEEAHKLKNYLTIIGEKLGIVVKVLITDGQQPVGRGIGPALEARDVLLVLKNDKNAPIDLRLRALTLAGLILEFSPIVKQGTGLELATSILDSGQAWNKFQSICQAQGGMRNIPIAEHTHDYLSHRSGIVTGIDNRRLALIATLAGAPADKVAGVDLHVKIGDKIKINDALFTIYAHSTGNLEYALRYIAEGNEIIQIKA